MHRCSHFRKVQVNRKVTTDDTVRHRDTGLSSDNAGQVHGKSYRSRQIYFARRIGRLALPLDPPIAGFADGMFRITAAQPERHPAHLATARAPVFRLVLSSIAVLADRTAVWDERLRDLHHATLHTHAPRAGESSVAPSAEWMLFR